MEESYQIGDQCMESRENEGEDDFFLSEQILTLMLVVSNQHKEPKL